MSLNTNEQDTFVLDTFAIEREARMLRAQATSRFIANARAWVAEKLSGATAVSGKTA